MKKLSKINISAKNALGNVELLQLRGGLEDEGCSATSKIDACKGKAEGTSCCWMYEGSKSYGKCRVFAPNYELHCSDLN